MLAAPREGRALTKFGTTRNCPRFLAYCGARQYAREARLRTRPAHQEHEGAKADLKKLVPEDVREAVGHGLRAKRSKSGAISFDLFDAEANHAALQ